MIPQPQTPKEIKARFLENNEKFRELQDTNLSLGDFHTINEEEEEIWLMQCPKGADVALLQDQKLKLPGRTSQEELETVAVEFPQPVSHAFGLKNKKGHNSIKILHIKGSVVLRNRLKGSALPDVSTSQPSSSRVPMPSGLKERHPLHGIDYESKIKMCPKIVERLKQADEISASSKSQADEVSYSTKSKKKSKETTIALDSDGDVELVIPKKQKKKKQKRKHSTGDEDDDHSKKRKQKHSQSEDVAEDLQWIQML